jgi:UDP-N-acetylmuramoyl-L-alanyl-D-glutamate--2,6-diaminopimelate ligase
LAFLLSQVLGRFADAGSAGGLSVTGVQADSRIIMPGEVFFALPGANAHGDRFAAQALERGAIAIVTDRKLDSASVPVVVAGDVRGVYARAAALVSGSQPTSIAGVTGTNGKTSVAAFLRQIWHASGRASASIGTLGVETAEGLTQGALTTPDSLSLHRDLAALKAKGIEHVSLEASSHGLDQRRMDGVRFAAAGFTNLSRDHLDYHSDMDTYCAAKLRLFTDLLADDGTAVVNADGEASERFIAAALKRGVALITVGRSGDHFRLADLAPEGFAQRVTLRHQADEIRFLLPLAGAFQVSNALVALGLAVATGVTVEQTVATLEQIKGAKGRLELVAEHNGAAIFIDYSHTPAALETALKSLRPYVTGKLVVVFGAGGDRDKGKRPEMGQVAEAHADEGIVTDDNPRTEDPATIRAEVLTGAPMAREIGDRAEAIHTAVHAMQPGDVLLIAGKGHEDYQIIGTEKRHFSDHEAVLTAVRAAG